MADYRGQFLWYEYMTPAAEAAKTFYTRVIGWGTQAFKPGDDSYTLWLAGSRGVGGLMQMASDPSWRPNWTGYIGTPDVDDTTAHAERLGGTVLMKPTEIPSVGKFSILTDPYGAAFAAFTPYPPPTPPPARPDKPAVGDTTWHELWTADVAGALRFYGELFGWTAGDSMDMGPAGIYQMYKQADTVLGGIALKPKEVPGPCYFLYYVRIADLEQSMARTREGGGKVIMGPHEVPGGDVIAICQDPEGATFAMVQMKKA